MDFATGQRQDDVAREYLAGFTGTEVPSASVLPGVANSPGTDEHVAMEIAYPPGPFGPILIGQPGTERLDYLLGAWPTPARPTVRGQIVDPPSGSGRSPPGRGHIPAAVQPGSG